MKPPDLSPGEAIARPELWAAPGVPFLPSSQGQTQLATYLDLLVAWNRKLNLTGTRSPVSLMADLVQDSFFLASFLDNLFSRRTWPRPLTLDIGAGAGLPGIPLRLFWQHGDYVLVERRKKRAIFLKIACGRLNLVRIKVFAGEAQAFFAERPKAQCILSRAFMPWRELADFCIPGLTPDGFLVVMANDPPPAALPFAWQKAGALEYRLPGKTRWLWALERTA